VILANIAFLATSKTLSARALRPGLAHPVPGQRRLVVIGLIVRVSLTETPQFRAALAAKPDHSTPGRRGAAQGLAQGAAGRRTFIAPNAVSYIVITYSLS